MQLSTAVVQILCAAHNSCSVFKNSQLQLIQITNSCVWVTCVSVLYEMWDKWDDRDVVNFSSQGRANLVLLYLSDISLADTLQNTVMIDVIILYTNNIKCTAVPVLK